jgi:hypothetical protein
MEDNSLRSRRVDPRIPCTRKLHTEIFSGFVLAAAENITWNGTRQVAIFVSARACSRAHLESPAR